MKLDVYEMRQIILERNYARIGQMMADYFCVPGIKEVACKIQPDVNVSDVQDTHNEYLPQIRIAYGGQAYYWDPSFGFSQFATKSKWDFEIWVEREA